MLLQNELKSLSATAETSNRLLELSLEFMPDEPKAREFVTKLEETVAYLIEDRTISFETVVQEHITLMEENITLGYHSLSSRLDLFIKCCYAVGCILLVALAYLLYLFFL